MSEPTQAAATKADLARWRANLDDELNAAALYESMAEAEKDEERATIFRELAEVERSHAGTWRAKLEAAGVAVGKHRLSVKTRFVNIEF